MRISKRQRRADQEVERLMDMLAKRQAKVVDAQRKLEAAQARAKAVR